MTKDEKEILIAVGKFVLLKAVIYGAIAWGAHYTRRKVA